jgi:acyl-CoA dehydrogenase
MDVLGGKGICLGPKNFMGRAYQAVPIGITVEGANILTRSMIIFGQGVFRCHPYVLSEMDAVADPDARSGLAKFDRALAGHIGYAVRNAIRTKLLALTGARLARTPSGAAAVSARYYRHLTRFCSAFTLLADVSMLLLGGKLKRKEALSARLGDCLSYLYYGSAVLKRFEDTGRPEEDVPLLHWSMRYCLHNIQRAILGIVNNYPVGIIGSFLRWGIFPLGAHFQPPSDRLGQSVASLLLRTGAARDRLTEGIFISRDPDDVTGCLEHAMQLAIEAGAVENRVYKATKFVYQSDADEPRLQQAVRDGLISEDEADLLRRSVAATLNVIHVDDFQTVRS